MKKITDILFSYRTLLILLTLLGVGAAVATFIENDYDSTTARVLVYNHIWYEIVMVLTMVNMLGVIYRIKMWENLPRFIFHIAFVVILIGSGLTRYMGFEGVMHIREGKSTAQMISYEPYLEVKIQHEGKFYKELFPLDLSALGNSFDENIDFADKQLSIVYDDYQFRKVKGQAAGILKLRATLDKESEVVELMVQRGVQGVKKSLPFDGAVVTLSYGSKPLSLPFQIKLREFQLDRYPGSMSPSSYASEVTLIDKENSVEFDYRIYMNNTLKYGHYQFFQSSYDRDEAGTILSVNNDPGKWPTYLGYFLLTLGLVLNLFDKKSRFFKLTKYIKQFNQMAIIAAVVLMFGSELKADPASYDYQSDVQYYLKEYKQNSVGTAEQFGRLVVQSNMGRMKPLDSLNVEILNKLSRKSSLYGLNPNQVILGMLARPDIWKHVQIIKIRTPKLKKILGVESGRKYIATSEIYNGKIYKLQKYVAEANEITPAQRGTFEKDVLRVDERLNIAYLVFYGRLFSLFPKPNDFNNKWLNHTEAMKSIHGKERNEVKKIISGLIGSVADKKYEKANGFIDNLADYQKRVGAKVIPSESEIDNEILFNSLQIFPRLTLAYILVGLLIFIIAFTAVFKQNWSSVKVNKAMYFILLLLFAIHTFGMGMRWYVSGHAPWSDTYESLLYIAWSSMFAGVIFFRRSMLALSATVVMSGIFMFTAHLTGIDPQITDLVPVLKSFWLTIHVSIITGSYGFLGIGAVLGFMALLLFVFRNPKNPNIDASIKQITAINEAALIIGLSALVIGNFLGGVWANESWGRYWGWDPKETWAYVAIVVYIFVLHLRLIKKLNTPFIFSVASLVAFSSILMTYFGVNFYLSGMHSYATGDPVPVPTWVYVLAASIVVLIAVAYRKRDMERLKV